MQADMIYYPMIAMFVLTAAIGMRMAFLRFNVVKTGELDPRYYKLNKGYEVPENLAKVSNNFDNLMATPILFYIVCLAIGLNGYADALSVGVAWIYVATRVWHSFIHIGANCVMPRMRAFMASLVALTGLWLFFAFNIIVR